MQTETQSTTTAQTAADTTEAQATSQPAETQGTQSAQPPGQQQQAPEGQTQQTEAKADDAPKGAPEAYEFKAPEGASFDDAVIKAYSEVAKELNLPQESAQKVLDKVAPVLAQRQAEQIQAAQTEWANTSKSDAEFGGEKLDENLGIAKKALETFGTPELGKLLNESGLGNHPEVIRLLYRAGKAISEDSFVGSGKAAKAEKSIAQRMYPNMNP